MSVFCSGREKNKTSGKEDNRGMEMRKDLETKLALAATGDGGGGAEDVNGARSYEAWGNRKGSSSYTRGAHRTQGELIIGVCTTTVICV